MKRLFTGYWHALEGQYRRAATVVLAIALGGLFEGAALTALIPALNLASGSTVNTPGPLAGLLAPEGLGRRAVIERSLATFVVLGAISALATFVVEREALRLRFHLEASLRERVTGAVFGMSWPEFVQLRLGDVAKTVLFDGNQTGLGVERMVRAVGGALVTLIFFVVALLLSPALTLGAAAFGGLAVLGYRRMGRRSSSHSQEVSRLADLMTAEVTEIFGGLKFLRAAGLRDRAVERADELYLKFRDTSVSAYLPSSLVRLAYETGGVAVVAAFLAVTLLVRTQDVGTALVFLAVFYRLSPRISAMSDHLYQAAVMLPWYESSRRIVDQAREHQVVEKGGRALDGVSELVLRDVAFSYPGRARVLRGVDLELQRGRCVAIVGESGSGKTTLLDLCTGLLKADGGQLLIDGTSIDEVDLNWWRSRIGLVMQDSPVFHMTVAENVSFGDDVPDRARVQRVLEAAAAWPFVSTLPGGMDAEIGDRGGRLSGGQRQRIALARALYREPDLLLLDEATSALDARSEELIYNAVDALRSTCAVAIVTHRLTTIGFADEIVLLHDGEVAERGTWEQLIAAGGRFAELVTKQRGAERLPTDAADEVADAGEA